MKARKLLVVLLVVLLCGLCKGAGLVGQVAPEITIQQWITQNPPEIEKMIGKVWVVEFWATWCPPCVENIPHLIKLNKKYKNKGLEFVALSQDRSPEMLTEFVRNKGINYHVAIDNGTTNWFGIKGYPTAVVIDHRGKVVWQGYPWTRSFEKAISKALAARPTFASQK